MHDANSAMNAKPLIAEICVLRALAVFELNGRRLSPNALHRGLFSVDRKTAVCLIDSGLALRVHMNLRGGRKDRPSRLKGADVQTPAVGSAIGKDSRSGRALTR